ncbi:uncharacterized protein LOC110862873 [Folsomia candida]|uniref:uncharacterized protein LOC110862648 n=1 Tax=Folsomia candida TaxID=158441 RepID=UPI000B8FEE10|nr:uncharacterized protein LOC110862648 [Folsomia candida]XP_021967776.1 uncharacterized protein LOC110862873 [Folsomia candida]
MGRPSNPNLKPIAHRKEESGFQKAKKRKEIALKNQKMAANASKYFKIDPAKDNEVAQDNQPAVRVQEDQINNLHLLQNINVATSSLDTVSLSEVGSEVVENFLGFIRFDGKTGEEITEMIITQLKQDRIDIKKCRGQGYENGSNMSGIYKGVQARIKLINPMATYIPCAAHSLNLVGKNAASKSASAKLILGQVQNLYVFFSSSTIRWSAMKKFCKLTLKSQSNTRWSSKALAMRCIYEEFDGICEALLELAHSDQVNAQTVAEAIAHFKQIFNFKFLLGITIWSKILSSINVANEALQEKACTIERAAHHLQGLLNWLQEFQTCGYNKSLEVAKSKALQLGVDEKSGFEYRATRNIRPIRFRIEAETCDQSPLSNEDKFNHDFF